MDMSHVKQYTFMKKFIVMALMPALWTVLGAAKGDDCITKDGYCKGIRLCGRVKVVESFPDFKVKVVESFPDLKVKAVESFPDSPGKWKFVDSSPDFKIKFVESGADFTIKFVDGFPCVSRPCSD